MAEGKGVGALLQHGRRAYAEAHCTVFGEVEVFDLEAWGVWMALQSAIEAAGALGSTHILLFTDNLSVARSALGQPHGSAQHVFLEVQRLAKHWLELDADNHLTLAWVPGHDGVTGNLRADDLARAGARSTNIDGRAPEVRTSGGRSWASFRRWDRAVLQDAWAERWTHERALTSRYGQIRQRLPTLRPSADLTLPRRQHGLLVSVRTGHGDFAPYHQRFHHRDASLYCRCGTLKDPEHPLTCDTYASHQHFLHNDNGRIDLSWLLDSPRGSLAFARYAQASNAFACNLQQLAVM